MTIGEQMAGRVGLFLRVDDFAKAPSVIHQASNTLGAIYWYVRIRDGARTPKGAESFFE